MKEIKIKIYGWSDLKKWFWDLFCYPRRKLVDECLDYYYSEVRSLAERVLIFYNREDLEINNYAALSRALQDWDVEIKKIRDRTVELIMMKQWRNSYGNYKKDF